MTIRTLRSNEKESDNLFEGKQMFVIRSDKEVYHETDIIQFQCYKNKKPSYHKNNGKSYVVTLVMDCMSAPIMKGHQIIGVRRMS